MLTFFKDIKYDLHILEAMANNRADGIKKVNSLLNQIILHLIKIAIYNWKNDRTTQVEGWQDEIVGWLDQIDVYCNNLKKNNQLKFKDYMLCLQDDLGKTHLVTSKVRSCCIKYKGKCNKLMDCEPLRKILWGILEQQFKDISKTRWDIESLTQHKGYQSLVNNAFTGGAK